MQMFRDANYNFIRWRWHALVLSAVVVLAGLVAVVRLGGLPLGVDFSGGTIVTVRFEQPVDADAVRTAVDPVPGDKVVQRYGEVADNEWLIRLPLDESVEVAAGLSEGADQIVAALQAANLPAFEVISTDLVGPVVGADLQRRGIYATVLALLGITVYITFRFRFSFAVGALVALVHDVLVTLALLTLFGYELSLNVVAAILTITGYSVNDTIVVYDRVRENMRKMRREPLATNVNVSVNQMLARTVITSGTTFITVLSLYLLGGEVLHGFAFTLLVGVVTGTYSSTFIAASVAIMMGQSKAKAAAAPQAAGAPAREGRKARRARAS